MRVVDRLGSLQFDPIDVAGRNHDLTLLARIDGYRRAWTDDLLYARPGAVRDVQQDAVARAHGRAAVVPDHLGPPPRGARGRGVRRARAAGRGAARADPRRTAPLSSTDIEPRAAIDWYWRPTNQVRALLEALAEAGILAIARREGNRRVYDLTERLFPADAARARRCRPTSSCATSCCRAIGATGCSARRGSTRCGWALGKAPERRRVPRRAGRGRARSRPSRSRASAAPRFVVTDELPILDAAEAEVAAEAGAGAPRPARRAASRAWRSSRRSTRWPGTATCWSGCSSSTTAGRSTCRRPSAAGATTCCRCSTATGSWAGSSSGSTAPAATLRVLGLWWEAGFDPLDAAHDGFVAAFAAALRAHADFGGVRRSSCRAWPGIARSPARCASGCRTPRASRISPGWRPIMPAATVLLLASSTRMNAPVARFCEVRVDEQRLGRAQLDPADLVERELGRRPRRGAAC